LVHQHKDIKHTWISKSKIYSSLPIFLIKGFSILSFRELVNNNPVQKLLTVEDFKKYREEVRKGSNEKEDDEAPPGLDEGN
jgi:hypothetical protein